MDPVCGGRPWEREAPAGVGEWGHPDAVSRREFLAVAGAGLAAMSRPSSAPAQEGLPLLKACINGARPVGSHPALPVTPEECARAAVDAVRAGAGAIHVHVRAPEGEESLDPDDVERTLVAMREAVPDTPIGCSTHFRIVGDADRRLTIVEGWSELPDFASVNFHEPGAVELARLLLEMAVGVEAGLFHADAARILVSSRIGPQCVRHMLEPGAGELDEVLRGVTETEAVLGAAGLENPRLLHGSRGTSWPLIDEAARRGYQTRAGLEDTFELPDGATARDNADIVGAAAQQIAQIVGGG